MLILTRRVRERIVIRDNILVTILGVSRKQVKVGVNAPRGVTVHREEVYLQIQAEKQINAHTINIEQLENVNTKELCELFTSCLTEIESLSRSVNVDTYCKNNMKLEHAQLQRIQNFAAEVREMWSVLRRRF